MNDYSPIDTLHRLIKEVIDSGEAASLAEAEAMFRQYFLHFTIGEAEASDPLHQAALLTGVVLGKRVFLGGTWVSGSLDTPLLVPHPIGETLGDAVTRLGGYTGTAPDSALCVSIGGGPLSRSNGFHIRTAYAGWRGGIIPAYAEEQPAPGPTMPLAPMLASAFAVNEAFFFARTGSSAAGRRPIGLSLWNPASTTNWLDAAEDEPYLRYLPSRLWLIGLGHLGQAYLWGLGLLPYANPSAVSLVLQDVDFITPSTTSTSILTEVSMIGQKKTRAMAAWTDQRGFSSVIIERLFSNDFHRQPGEPCLALCGMDNALGRRSLDQVGFDFVVEAGLGRGYQNFRSMRLHVLPSQRSAAEIWQEQAEEEEVSDRPGYQEMVINRGLDQCGITLLAGKAVGAPFVGTVAACLALSEVLRLLHGGTVHKVIDLDLLSVEHRSVVPHEQDFSRFNPGYVDALM